MNWRDHNTCLMLGSYDSRKGRTTGYGTITLGEIIQLKPTDLEKTKAMAIIPSSYCEANARSHAKQREHGSFVALVGDVDKGNHSLEILNELLAEALGDDVGAFIYSTSSATAINRKWRFIIPLAQPQPYCAWFAMMHGLYAFMDSRGVELDKALLRPGQLCYLPNVAPENQAAKFCDVKFVDGEGATPESGLLPQLIARWLREMEAEEAAKEAARASVAAARVLKPSREGSSIEAFNRANPLTDVLLSYGYTQSPYNDDDWRSRYQTSGSYATRIYRDEEGKERWVSLSGSDAEKGLGVAGKGCRWGGPFDLKVHYEYGGDFNAALRALSTPQPDTGRYRLISATELAQRPPIRWRVKGLLPTDGIAAIYGHPGSGKTFISMDLLGAISRGVPWFDHKTYACPVTYIALEGEAGIAQRVKAYEKQHGPLPVNVHFVAQSFNLLNPQDLTDLATAIIASGGRDGVICIDTLNRASAGADENDSRDMGKIIEATKQLQREVGGLVMLVHHSGKEASRGLRGHSSLLAALDASIEVVKTEVQRSWKITKSKDGSDDRSGAFHLDIIELGVDSEGEAITSCVILASNDPVQHTKSLTPLQQQGVDAYVRAAERHGMWKDGKFIGLRTESWREEYYRRSTSDTADTKRKSFNRIRAAYVKLDLLVVDGEMNLLLTPAVQSLTPPIGVIGEALAGVLMRDSGTLAGQSRDRSLDS
jgi:hypothetical protein